MSRSTLRALLFACLFLSLSLSACMPWIRSVQGFLNPTKTYAVFMPPTQVPALPLPSETPVPGGTLVPVGTGVPLNTPEPSATLLPSATLIPADTAIPPPPTVVATWVWHDAGQATLPILLYHHISSDDGENRYYVNPENFRQQMHALRDWGYTSITPSYLTQVLIHGGELPERPVIITFDDGNEDVYINAFPILQEFGFVGTFYIVADKIGSYNLVDAEQLHELVSAGWEIGSHSSTHLDLTSNYSQMEYEVLGSRLTLEEAIGVPVLSFAYPFGEADDYIYQMTAEYGYTHGMGLGAFTEHSLETLFHLSRCEVQYEFDMDAFAALLPWTGPPPTP